MKVGDLIKRIVQRTPLSRLMSFNSLAIVVGFDPDGDLLLRYANPSEPWENREDVDYKSAWALVE